MVAIPQKVIELLIIHLTEYNGLFFGSERNLRTCLRLWWRKLPKNSLTTCICQCYRLKQKLEKLCWTLWLCS